MPDADPEVLLLAYVQAKADGDEKTAASIREMMPEPEPAEEMADDSPVLDPSTEWPTPSRDTALAGKDGHSFARLIADAQSYGAETLWELVRESLRGYGGIGPIPNPSRLSRLSESLAAVNGTAELMGRTRVREMHDRALQSGGLSKFADDSPLSTFADPPSRSVIDTPESALAYFESLTPKLGVDPDRWIGEQRRKAFTLAVSTNKVLTNRIQEEIAKGLRENKSVADATSEISKRLEAAGVSRKNPQYAEMVYRTNAQDAFQTGMYEEGRHPDVEGVFPVWRYLIVDDRRTGDDHRPKGGRYYSAETPFARARGLRPWNCRCSMQWVDFMDWEEEQTRGAKVSRDYD